MSRSCSGPAAADMAASTAAGKQRIPKVAKVGDREGPQAEHLWCGALETRGSELFACLGRWRGAGVLSLRARLVSAQPSF